MRRQSITAYRKSHIEVLPDGTVITGDEQEINIRASIQPFDKKQMEQYPHLRNYKQLYTLYSDTPLQVSKAGKTECDIVSIYDDRFDVLSNEQWQNKIRSHYKIIIGK
jgi:hypothetical protein